MVKLLGGLAALFCAVAAVSAQAQRTVPALTNVVPLHGDSVRIQSPRFYDNSMGATAAFVLQGDEAGNEIPVGGVTYLVDGVGVVVQNTTSDTGTYSLTFNVYNALDPVTSLPDPGSLLLTSTEPEIPKSTTAAYIVTRRVDDGEIEAPVAVPPIDISFQGQTESAFFLSIVSNDMDTAVQINPAGAGFDVFFDFGPTLAPGYYNFGGNPKARFTFLAEGVAQ